MNAFLSRDITVSIIIKKWKSDIQRVFQLQNLKILIEKYQNL